MAGAAASRDRARRHLEVAAGLTAVAALLEEDAAAAAAAADAAAAAAAAAGDAGALLARLDLRCRR